MIWKTHGWLVFWLPTWMERLSVICFHSFLKNCDLNLVTRSVRVLNVEVDIHQMLRLISTRFVPQQSRVPNSMWEWGVYLGSKCNSYYFLLTITIIMVLIILTITIMVLIILIITIMVLIILIITIMVLIIIVTLWLMFQPPGCNCLLAEGRRWASCWKTKWSSPLTKSMQQQQQRKQQQQQR